MQVSLSYARAERVYVPVRCTLQPRLGFSLQAIPDIITRQSSAKEIQSCHGTSFLSSSLHCCLFHPHFHKTRRTKPRGRSRVGASPFPVGPGRLTRRKLRRV